MARCNQCGADLPDYYTSCPNCGGTVSQTPLMMQQSMGGYVPMSQQREITSMGGWFGWTLLCAWLPIIGSIIMLNTTKDPTAKNYAKLMLILQIVAIVIYIIIFAVMAAAGNSLSRYY